jgi:hypothetical protein
MTSRSARGDTPLTYHRKEDLLVAGGGPFEVDPAVYSSYVNNIINNVCLPSNCSTMFDNVRFNDIFTLKFLHAAACMFVNV